MSRGALYPLLKNRIYIGEIQHHGQAYPGQYEAIVDRDLFDAVPRPDSPHNATITAAGAPAPACSPASCLMPKANRLSPSHASNGNRRYRYYVSQRVMYGGKSRTVARWPAESLERYLCQAISERLRQPDTWLANAVGIDGLEAIRVLADGPPEAMTGLLKSATLNRCAAATLAAASVCSASE